MTLELDTITYQKLVLVKHLFTEAFRHSKLRHHIANRTLAIIIFDVTIETMLKVVVASLDTRKVPSNKFQGLVDQCDRLLQEHGYNLISNKTQILRLHTFRNDAQHKARYPNPEDIEEAKVHALDLCRELTYKIWGESFEDISLLSWITDETLLQLLERSQECLAKGHIDKSLTLSTLAFNWASRSMSELMPRGVRPLNASQLPELDSSSVDYLSSVIKAAENSAKRYAALMTTGVTPTEYQRFRDVTPRIHLIGSIDISKPKERKLCIDVHWQDREPKSEDAHWVFDLTVNSIVGWQNLGLSPTVDDPEMVREAQALIWWDEEIVMIM